MKVLFVNTLYAPNLVGGAERILQSVAEGMVEAGHEAIVVSAAPRKGTRTGWINGVKVYYVGLRNLYWPFRKEGNPAALKPLWHALDTRNPWMARQVERILEIERPDLVHTNCLAGFSPLVWKPVKRRRLPLVHTLFDYHLLCPRATMFRNGENCGRQCADCRLYSLPRKPPSNRVDAVVGNSRFILDRHLEFGYFAETPERLAIHNAYRADPAASGHSARPEDAGPSRVRLGFMGQLTAAKGVESLLEATKLLPEGSWSLEVAGRGVESYERELRARCESSSVRFLGHVRPAEFLPGIDVLIVPSLWHDPMPRVVSEAFAHGVPVVGSRRGGIQEQVEDGRTGFLFEPDVPGDLALKVRGILDDPQIISGMGSNCLEKAGSFLPENVTAQYLKLYASVMEGR